jgi:hypothetical protein
MFGDNEPIYRVFRTNAKGKVEKGLVYKSQLDALNTPQTSEEPAGEFSLQGGNGESRNEQPALFGAGDMGEIIGNPNSIPPFLRKGKPTPEGQGSLFREQPRRRAFKFAVNSR